MFEFCCLYKLHIIILPRRLDALLVITNMIERIRTCHIVRKLIYTEAVASVLNQWDSVGGLPGLVFAKTLAILALQARLVLGRQCSIVTFHI